MFLPEALHQIKSILWFFGMKTCKEESYVDKTKLCITKIQENDILLFSIKPVTAEWFL